MSRRDELRALARTNPETLVDYTLALEARVRPLEARVAELEGRLAQNSANSGRPPGSDGPAKPAPKSLRGRTGRRPGGQSGHEGRTLQPVARPDAVVNHALGRCPCGLCGGVLLHGQAVIDRVCRQVFDLPPLRLHVTEHRAEVRMCPISGRRVVASFPDGIEAPTQYGPNFHTLIVYLSQQQFLPHERLSQLCEDLFGQPLSTGTVVRINERFSARLESFEVALLSQLRQAPVLHVDESGLRVEGRLHWLHVACTATLTHYGVHPKRGTEATVAIGILPHCEGWLIHDHWTPYFTYTGVCHGLCNEHLLRELKFVAEEEKEPWAAELSQWLLRAYRRRQRRGVLGQRAFRRAHRRYLAILSRGERLHAAGRAGAKAAKLLRRLRDFDLSVLAFLFEPEVPFTNNQAEQDIRMVKVRQKISGCFRTLEGARLFARIRSYLSTCRKQGHNLWEAIRRAVTGSPFTPQPQPVAAAP